MRPGGPPLLLWALWGLASWALLALLGFALWEAVRAVL